MKYTVLCSTVVSATTLRVVSSGTKLVLRRNIANTGRTPWMKCRFIRMCRPWRSVDAWREKLPGYSSSAEKNNGRRSGNVRGRRARLAIKGGAIMPKKRKVVWVGGSPITPISAKERREIDKSITKHLKRLRRRYPEVQGKIVDFISHSIQDGTLYFTVRFKDKTDFSLRYACEMFVVAVGADFCDVKTGDFEMIREYIRPIPR
ncbi:MAG: hypothetical protein WB795_19280 [Candidatus Acidiferrales bacterium]